MGTVPPRPDIREETEALEDVGEVAALLARFVGTGPNRISQREAERRTGVPRETIGAILRGVTALPEDQTMDRLTAGLDLDPDEVAAALARDRARSFIQFKGEDKLRDPEEAASRMTDEEWSEYLRNLDRVRRSARKAAKP